MVTQHSVPMMLKDAAYLVGCPNLTVGHMPGYYDHTQYNIVVLLFTEADGRPSQNLSLEIDTAALEFCKPVTNSRLAWCFIAKNS
ncbi:hypothetical protein EVAR_35356_1 [Eumeta japonica]|uniref:Uncharacterized protein n=1 Tax=Eumeta variegata TaxID=151549 RepID=A0A4C1ZZW1_EUMVA|nr:hypothetical protein EVAR_35356_1 [Eumeta japonica]